MTTKATCNRSKIHNATDDELDSVAQAIQTGLADNVVDFPTPDVTAAALAVLITTYNTTHNAYKRGGIDQKPAFDNAKEALLNALFLDAEYVDEIADGSETLITAAGYIPTKTSGTPIPATVQPTGVKVTLGDGPGEFFVECDSQEQADAYGLLVAKGAELTGIVMLSGQLGITGTTNLQGIDLTKSRKKHLQGLTPGVNYYFYMYALNNKGVSALSVAVKKMAGE